VVQGTSMRFCPHPEDKLLGLGLDEDDPSLTL